MPGRTGCLKVAEEIAGTYIPAHQVRQFQPLGFSENLMPISISVS